MPNPCFYCGIPTMLANQHRENCPNRLSAWGSGQTRQRAIELFESGYRDGCRSSADENHPKSDEIAYHMGWNKARKERGIHGNAVIVVKPF